MRMATAYALAAVLCASILTSWTPERWPVSLIEIGAFVLAQAWIVRLAWRGESPRLDVTLLAPALLLVWGALQMALGWTAALSETARGTLAWGAYLALLFAALQAFEDRFARRRFLHILLWFAFAVSLEAILQAFTASGRVFWLFPVPDPSYFMGPFLYHNHFAAFVEALLPLALAGAMDHPAKRLWYALAAAILAAAVIVSASRSGVAIVAVEIVAVIAVHQWRARHRPSRILPAAAIVLAMVAAIASLAGWESLTVRLNEPDPYLDRLQMLRSSLDMIRDHPFTGVGLNNWPTVFPYYARYDDGRFANQAHNDWAQLAAEAGLAGLAAFGLLFAVALRRGLRDVRALGVVCVFIHAFFDYPFEKPQIAALVLLLLAASAPPQEDILSGDLDNLSSPLPGFRPVTIEDSTN